MIDKTLVYTGDIVLSVDSDEWYYGNPKHRLDPEHRVKITGLVDAKTIVSQQYASFINEIFLYLQNRERDTLKRKKRDFYVDRSFFI